MKKFGIVSLILMLCTLLSSCHSVYIDPEESSDIQSEIIEGEYFTDGSIYKKGNAYAGFFYEGCWIYVETQMTIGPKGYYTGGLDDEPRYIYGDVEMKRIVKYNPTTGVVSSPCLDPVCNHSFESGCLMLSPRIVRKQGEKPSQSMVTFVIESIIDDWMVIFIQRYDDEYVTLNQTIFYNLKTGETKNLFEENLGGAVMTRWNDGSSFEGNYYNVKQTLDYSETDYKHGSKNENVLDHAPKTIQTLCEFDIDNGLSKELFEIPETYSLIAVSNERFFFIDDANVYYTCKRDGSNMARHEHLDFIPGNLIGTYAYTFSELDGFKRFDLKNNEKQSMSVEYDEYMQCAVGEGCILFDHVSTYEDYQKFLNNKDKFINAYSSQMQNYEAMELFNEECVRILYGGTSQIFKTDLDGENMRLIYEEEGVVIASVYASGDYVFAIRETPTVFGEKCIINIKTGEITVPPLLDIIVPDSYVNK